MVAHYGQYGQIDFHGVGHGRSDRLVAGGGFASPPHAADRVVAEGHGKMLLTGRSFGVNSRDLDEGNLTLRAGNVLAFQPSPPPKQSITPGFRTLTGTGKFAAASDGRVVVTEPPLRIAPPALVGRAGRPSPCPRRDHRYLRGFPGGRRARTGSGGTSGEEHRYECTGTEIVPLRPAEQILPEPATGTPEEGRIPGGAGHAAQSGSQLPQLPGDIGGLQRRFGL